MKKLYLPLLTLHFSLFTLHSQSAVPIEILPGPFADVRGNLVIETIPFDAAIDKPMRWVFSDPGTMRPARIVKDLDLSELALYPDAPATNFIAYIDADASGSYTPGEPFGVSNEQSNNPNNRTIELTDMSAITPRVNLWSGACDRSAWTGTNWLNIGSALYDRFEKTTAKFPKTHVLVVRYAVDKFPVYKVGVDAGVVLEKDFEETSRDFLHEGDFLADGDLDLDWKNLYEEVLQSEGVLDEGCNVTNVSYVITFNFGPTEFSGITDTNTVMSALSTLVTRRFEKTRTIPTPVSASIEQSNNPNNQTIATFSWKIENEDKWASFFGTTYTAFKIVASNETTEVFNSGIRRLPARDQNGVYTFTTTDYSLFTLNSSLSWRVAVYNAKFKTDTLMTIQNNRLVTGDPFSPPQPIGDEPPPVLNPTGTVDIAIYPGPNASRRGPIIIEQERNPFRYRTPQKWMIPDCRLRRPPVITHSVFCSDTNTPFIAYIDTDASGSYTPGEPFGVSNEQSNNPNNRTIELTDMSAITPRVRLWGTDGLTNASDRSVWTGTGWTTELPIKLSKWVYYESGSRKHVIYTTNAYDRLNRMTSAPSEKVNVKVVRYTVDNSSLNETRVPARVVLEKAFERESRDFMHEGDFLSEGDIDLDWRNLYNEVIQSEGVLDAGCKVTNISYIISFNFGTTAFSSDDDTNTVISAYSTLVTRRFEAERTVPTPVSAYATQTNSVFQFRIENEDKWASWFGTTYTAFKVVVSNETTEVFNSGIRSLPARDINGVYTFTTTDSSLLTLNSSLSWRAALYNAKFKTDDLMTIQDSHLVTGDPFSPAQPITTP